MQLDLVQKRYLVTGASGGIGQCLVKLLLNEGAQVIAHYHANHEAAQELVGFDPERCHAIQADLRSEQDVRRLFERAGEHLGGALDGVVVNAGIWVERTTPVVEMSLAQWNDTLATDLTSAFLTCRGFLRQLQAAGADRGSIVLVGSTAALFGEAGHADYAAAKAAMVYGLLRTLKNEIVQTARFGRVNAVAPGWVATPMAASALETPGVLETATATMPLKKVAEPFDVAAAVAFLLSDAVSGHVSGAVVPVAGGMEGRLQSVGDGDAGADAEAAGSTPTSASEGAESESTD